MVTLDSFPFPVRHYRSWFGARQVTRICSPSSLGRVVVFLLELPEELPTGLIKSGQSGLFVGPSVVPGNSRYSYSSRVNGQAGADAYELRRTVTDQANIDADTVVKVAEALAPVYDPVTKTTLFAYNLEFLNARPSKLKLELIDKATKQPIVDPATNLPTPPKEVIVVQVLVEQANATTRPIKFDAESQELEGGRAPIKVSSEYPRGEGQGINFDAKVTLKGPGNNEGVDKIQVGFAQRVKVVANRAQYGTPGNDRWIISPTQGMTLRDTVLEFERFYAEADPDAVMKNAMPGAQAPTKTIKALDAPGNSFDMTWQSNTLREVKTQYPSVDFLKKLYIDYQFTTYVSAVTTDSAGGASSYVWADAKMTWTFNATRELTKVTPIMQDGVITKFNYTWEMPDPSSLSVTRVGGRPWTYVVFPTAVSLTDPWANGAILKPNTRSTSTQP